MATRAAAATFAILSAVAGSWAQQPPVTPPNSCPSPASLFQEARDALTALPKDIQPQYLDYLAEKERFGPGGFLDGDEAQNALRRSAEADAAAAFHQAVAISPNADGPDREGGWPILKTQAELDALSITRMLDPAAALALVRVSDMAGFELAIQYNDVISDGGRPSLGPNAPAMFDVLEVARESEQRAGKFPFSGAANVLRNNRVSPEVPVDLVREGYRAAGEEDLGLNVVLNFSNQELAFLRAGHQYAPQLDSELSPVLESLIRRLANLPPEVTKHSGFASSAGLRASGQLLSLLQEADPVRAVTLRAEVPAASTAAQLLPGPVTSDSDPNSYSRALRADPAAALADAQRIQDTWQRFQALARQARDLSSNVFVQGGGKLLSDPSGARAAAAAALAMVNDDLIQRELAVVSAFVDTLHRLGFDSQAAELLARCLDEADREVAQREQRGPWQMESQWEDSLASLARSGNPQMGVYESAVRMDHDATIAHAEQLQDPALRTLALATVASWAGTEGCKSH